MGLAEDKILLDKLLADKVFAYDYINKKYLGMVSNFINDSFLVDCGYDPVDVLHDLCAKLLFSKDDNGKVVNKLETINLNEKRSLHGWFYTVIRNFCIDLMNKHMTEHEEVVFDDDTGEVERTVKKTRKIDFVPYEEEEMGLCGGDVFHVSDYEANKNVGLKVLMPIINKIQNDNYRKILTDYFLENQPMETIRWSMGMSATVFDTYKYRALDIFTKYLVMERIINEAERAEILRRRARASAPVGGTLECLVGFKSFVVRRSAVVWDDMDMNWLKSKLFDLD